MFASLSMAARWFYARCRAGAGASLLRLHTLFHWAEEVPVRCTVGASQLVRHINSPK